MQSEPLPIVSHLSADQGLAFPNPQNLARPAGIEPAAPRLGVQRKETIWGSPTRLPLILLGFCQAPDRLRPLRAATDCQPFVSRVLFAAKLYAGPSPPRSDRSCQLDDRLTTINCRDNLRQLRFETPKKFDTPGISNSDPHYRRSFVQDPMDCEVFILCDDHCSVFCGVSANLFVRSLFEPAIGYVLGIVAERLNSSCESRRELSVDEEAQSCAPQHRVIVLLRGELQNRGDVVGLEIGIIREDLLARRARGEQIENVFDTDPKAADARTATAHLRVHRDSVHRAHTVPLYRGFEQILRFFGSTVLPAAKDASPNQFYDTRIIDKLKK